MNAVEIEQAITDPAEQPFDLAEFPFAFLQAFGNKDATIKKIHENAFDICGTLGMVLRGGNVHHRPSDGKDPRLSDPKLCI